MSPTIEEQIGRLKSTIAEMEAQRESLGDEVVDAGLVPFQRKLDELVAMLQSQNAQAPTIPTQQRKLVTMLFMDIAGSTAIAQHMDPEDVSEVFDVTLKKLAQPVEAHGGRVTRFMGDGFLSVFGVPKAREDDPEQAVRAGLEILSLAGEMAGELGQKWGIEDFQVRVGVNTGLVLLGGETEAEDTLMGAAVNLAARLEGAAPAGGLLVSHDTYRHIRGVFDVEPWDPLQVKGFDEPVQIYRILRAKPRSFRSYARGVEGVETRMVGRETELKYLQDALLTAIEEKFGEIVTITGEAGVGKSRLLYEFQNWIELLPQPAVRFYEGRAQQESQGLPYGLLRDLFEFRFQIQEDDSREIVREKIETGFVEVFGESDEARMRVHILGQLLGFDFSASPHLKGVLNDPEQLRNRGLMYLGEYFKELCRQDPVVVLLEDIHWADDSSLDALNWLGERLHRNKPLFVCTARHSLLERRPSWGVGLDYHHRLELEPLSRRESHHLVSEILKLADQIPPELSDLVVEGAEGNPFYVEELVKILVEDGVIIKGEDSWQVHPERLSEIEVPSTLVGVLQARLDSLPPKERVVLQQASIVGRIFWDRVLEHIQAAEGGRPQVVTEVLTSLRGREMVYRREASAFLDANEYLFKHDILRDVTYEFVLKRLRRVYHGIVAEWLIQHSEERVGEYAGLIGDHLELAGKHEQAASYLYRAGEHAALRYANAEALAYFQRALDLAERQERYDRILARRAKVLLVVFQGQEAAKDYTHLLERARQSENRKNELAAMLGLAAAYYTLALDDPEFAPKSLDLYEQAKILAMELGDRSAMIRALIATMWFPNFWPKFRMQVVDNIEEAWTLSQEIADEDLMIDCMIARAQYDLVPVEQVEELLKRLEARRDLPRLKEASFRLTWRYLYLGNFARCVEHCDTSIMLAEKLGTPPVMYATIKALALLGLGRYDSAWKSLQEEIAGVGNPFGDAIKDFGTGMYLAGVMAHSEAISVFKGVIEQAKRVGRAWLSLWAQAELSKSQLKCERLEEINLNWTTQDLETDTALTADAMALLGEIALIHGDLDEALGQAEKAVAYAEARSWRPAQVSALVLQLQILLKLDRLRDVIILADKGIRMTEEMNHWPLLWRLQAVKAQALARLGEIGIAAENYRDAAAVILELAAAIGDSQLKQLFLSNALVMSVLEGEA